MLIDKKLTTYLDRPELNETFIDTVEGISVDNHCLRIELSVTRLDVKKRTSPPSCCRYPASRLVMPASTVVDLYNQLTQIVNAMEKKGKVKKGPQGPAVVQRPPSVQ
jgi:hypothetical protein